MPGLRQSACIMQVMAVRYATQHQQLSMPRSYDALTSARSSGEKVCLLPSSIQATSEMIYSLYSRCI